MRKPFVAGNWKMNKTVAESRHLVSELVPGLQAIDGIDKVLHDARTIVWNGPMGVFEFQKFAVGTFGVAEAVAESEAVSIVGGGDSVAAINQSGLQDRITHISTGGGASLEMMEGKVLPGIAALEDK